MTPVHKKEDGDKVSIRLALRDWIYIVMLLAGMVGYFVRIEVKTSGIDAMKVMEADHEKRLTAIEARHSARMVGPSRGDRDR